MEKAKIALIQFCVSPPKTDIEQSVVVSDYAAMDRVLKEERNYILQASSTPSYPVLLISCVTPFPGSRCVQSVLLPVRSAPVVCRLPTAEKNKDLSPLSAHRSW